ncbi:hypothetical protein Q9L42_019350 [Methylomarinum sp. Ch1-1]|uniref:Protochlamydia outer membrane protein domain-containing protein n=1 Tax=Methylomarinum roseum TaxID=3067653 RepID=A0AAU7NU06_9GAMM|nr:hypothetical protein [Methylomarinum sp. Ch1-1]MDP4519450.1 hypothetical protein [Methylomarinum sp. Ch1-1]
MKTSALFSAGCLIFAVHGVGYAGNRTITDDNINIAFFDPGAEPVEDEPTLHMVIYQEDDQAKTESKKDKYASKVDEQNIQMEFYINGGYRQDELDWNIAYPTGTPNILSELSWDDLEIATFGLGATMYLPANLVLDGKFTYGRIFNGDNQDSDYYGDNRTQEFSRSNNNADEGSTIDASVGLGYRFNIIPSSRRFKKPTLSFTPMVGFSYHEQNLKMTNGKQTVPFNYHFGGLDSSYDATWYGPWAGFDSELSIVDRVSFTTSFQYHYAFYEGTADWNLRQDFAHPESFSHEARGTGLDLSWGSLIRLNENLHLTLSVDYKNWKADNKGFDTTYLSDGRVLETKLNEVNWESLGANLGLQFNF